MLAAYLTQTQALLQLPGAPASLYSTTDLTRYINIARGQVAGEGACIRSLGTVPTVIGQRPYNFNTIDFGTPSVYGIEGAIRVENLLYSSGSGQLWVNPRPWQWFAYYKLNVVAPASGPPTTWAQYGQGAAAGGALGQGESTIGGGTLFLDPLPDQVYTLNCDCVCYPIVLVLDSDPEAIPYLWTDCVPFFAAYFALLSAQNNARMADAQRYYGMYQTFLTRARQAANPDVNRWQSMQSTDPVQAAKLGIKQPAAGGGG
jgi:hypothetical protein